ncbi:unnamed protein product, partial [Adineta ricciae]
MNNQCLFCDIQTVRPCCNQCQMKCRSELFVHLLSISGKIVAHSNYYNQIKLLCDRIRTIEWLITPFQFEPLEHFDSSVHKIDRQANVYLLRADPDVRDLFPVKTESDDSSLYHSIACLDSSKTITASELRIRTLLELIQNGQQYSERLAHIIGPLDEAIRRISRNYTFSELIQYRSELDAINTTFDFDPVGLPFNTIHIFWTHTQNEVEARQSNGSNWSPNHFVPLLLSSNSSHDWTASSPNYNNFLESTKSISSGSDLNKNLSAHSLLRGKQGHTSVVEQHPDNQRAAARVRMAAKGSVATPEQIEKELEASRNRMALKHGTSTSEETERERNASRERMAYMRSMDTTEKMEKQRKIDRERMTLKRAASSSEQIERQRVTTRERTAPKRFMSITDEVQQKQLSVSNRMVQHESTARCEATENAETLTHERTIFERNVSVPEDIQNQDSTVIEYATSKRLAVTPEQIRKRQEVDRERKASRRAAATPEQAENDRVAARERMASKRRSIVLAELADNSLLHEQLCDEVSNEDDNDPIILDLVQKHRIFGRTKNNEPRDEWFKPVSSDLKMKCLKNFIKHMSMDFLAEEICGICNIRCYKRDMHCVPIQKIPSVHVLKAHDALHDILLKTQLVRKACTKTYVQEGFDTASKTFTKTKDADTCGNSSLTTPSSIYENGVVFYERGLQHGSKNDRRQATRCNICQECWSYLKKEKIPKFSPANKVWIGEVPQELQNLTIPEQRLISLYRYNSCIVKLQSSFHSMETAQSALRGNCISFPQNVVNIAESLPLTLDQLCESLKIIFIGTQLPEKIRVKSILTVRKKKILNALQWLRQNNPLYRNIMINSSSIDHLPDDDVPECLWKTMEVSNNIEHSDQERANYVPDPLQEAQKSRDNVTVTLTTSAVVDVNAVSVSCEDVTKCLLEKIRMETKDKTATADAIEQNDQDTVYMIPRGHKPASEYLNPDLLMGMFPTLFPYGRGALEDSSRPDKISLLEHIRYLLSLENRRFQKNDSFIFIVFNILQSRTVCFHAQLMTTRPYFQQSAHKLETLTSNDVATALANISKQSNSSVDDPRVNVLMKHIKAVGGRVMGSCHSRSALRTKIHALCFYLGLPSLFVIINPADIHSPVALYFSGIDLNLDNILVEDMRTTYERAHIIAGHPVAAAKFFNVLIKNILKFLVLCGIVGPTSAYFGTVESQGRGSLHLHPLIWLGHDFTPAQLKEKIQDSEFRAKLLSYIEDVVKEDRDLFQDKTKDQSTKTTAVATNNSIQKTINANPASLPIPNPDSVNFVETFHEYVKKLVETVNIHKHSTTCYKYSKAKSDATKKCRMRMPRALVAASNIDPITGEIVMRRSHPWINNFNEWVITACQSNMDIKFIWSGSDAKALVYYITDYVTKSSLSFYDMFALAQEGVKSVEQRETKTVSENIIEKSRKLVLRCYNMIASHQEVSGVQVASYLMNYGDHYTTHTFQNLFLISIEHYLQIELNKER